MDEHKTDMILNLEHCVTNLIQDGVSVSEIQEIVDSLLETSQCDQGDE